MNKTLNQTLEHCHSLKGSLIDFRPDTVWCSISATTANAIQNGQHAL